ncbi:MAG: amidohydrolase family protein [Myxococcota bacterium]|nr:amidohydrolase family protein [Myxococcota bacterium]
MRPEQTQLIFSDRVMTGCSSDAIGPRLLEITDGLITRVDEIERSQIAAAVTPDAEVTDLGTHLVTPAFINSHTHLSMNVYRGIGLAAMAGNIVEDLYFHLESTLTAAEVRAFSRMGAYDCLLSGIGMVWDHYYHAQSVADALMDVGVTGVVAPTLQDLNGPGVQWLDQQWIATDAITHGRAYEKSGIYSALGPHATDTVSDSLWRKISDWAAKENIPIHAHVGQSIEEYERNITDYGCSPVARLGRLGVLASPVAFLLVHGQFVSRDDLGLLDKERHVLGHCPYSQVQFCFPAPVSIWQEAGIGIALGTDSGACNDTMNVQQELRLLAEGPTYRVTHSHLRRSFAEQSTQTTARSLDQFRVDERKNRTFMNDTHALLDTVWKTPGKIHPKVKCGQLRAGHLANLTVWNLEHPAIWPANDIQRSLAYADAAQALHGVMTKGVWRGKLGNFANSILNSDDFKQAQAEAVRRFDELKTRLGLKT